MLSRTISIFDIVLIDDRVAGYLALQDTLEALRLHSDWVHTAHIDLDTDHNLITEIAFATWCPDVKEMYLVDSQPFISTNNTTNAEILTLLNRALKLSSLEFTWSNCHPNWVRSCMQYLKPRTLQALALHGALTHVILNLQYNLNAALIPPDYAWTARATSTTSSYPSSGPVRISKSCLATTRRPMEEDDDDEEPVEAALAKTILKHCPKITKMILALQFNHSGLWSGVSLCLLEEFATIEHLHIDVLTLCVNLLEIKTTKGWRPNGTRLWSLDSDRCGVHVDELLTQSWGCLKLERVSLILVECARRSPKVEDEATQRRIAKKVIEFHRQLKMLDNLQVLELFWYFPY
ncbi:hypothetical protein BGZ81_001316 [Podila clonocystis]|nr:hypothetical protein BGZ81_001316 [Podila clonocystis]